ncbi:site-specific recombinase XerD [Arthrobacter silviterrae]|uniref:Tyrosine-type recombinase/integrase n=1 Tax=Arthrobacter silviterrae TaxID=2026658 RepID=A0ABX0DEF5_9MICC|nr:site-specific integrase [Arthrobacter silviterrae]MDQ0277475.1 site-specific recombinase XerD [Arthrobacter silviterrae]NGN85264.1 tyrosine-type recombinase/integrase [Arthrobacter silviterrae]
MTTHDFQHYLSEFLARFLPGEVGSATNTIKSYRDTFTLFLRYCKAHEDITPEHMTCGLLTKELVERFLAWLEAERGCCPATRNQRLAAIRSFCRYLQVRDVERIGQYQRVLAIPKKKTTTAPPRHVSVDGIRMILDQPDTSRPSGRRDLALLALMYDSGARVQEIADLTFGDLRADPPATVKLTGKGNKTRIVPLMAPTAALVQRYADGAGLTGPASRSRPLFPNRAGNKMTRTGIAYILDKHVTAAREGDPAALPDTISPHTFRHSKAMHLLQAGVNLVYIRDILGHADLKTTEIYARIDGEMKRRALQSAFTNLAPSDAMPLWHQDKDMLTWLTNLGH